MIFQFLQLLPQYPTLFIRMFGATVLGLVLAITVHEASHALLATLQGDNTAKSQGRLSLNPIAHLDPTGSVLMLLVGFGWGKPVPVNPFWLTLGPRLGNAVVAMAGPLSNILAAAVLSLPFRFGLLPWHEPFSMVLTVTPGWVLVDVLTIAILFNLSLAVFNLIPLFPLDGFNVVAGLLPRHLGDQFNRLQPYGMGLLMILVMVGYLRIFDFSLGTIISPVIHVLSLVVVGRAIT